MLPLNQLSLIIPTYNRQKIVFKTLQYITGQSISGFEVIIVDQTIEKDTNLIYSLRQTWNKQNTH